LRLAKCKGNIVTYIEDESEFRGYCKDIIRKHLNLYTYQKIQRSNANHTNYYTFNDGITITHTELKAAYDKDFLLDREYKQLHKRLEERDGFKKQESYFLSPPNIIPFKDGVYNIKTRQFCPDDRHPYIKRINADFKPEMRPDDLHQLPEPFLQLLSNALRRPYATKQENANRVESLLQILSYNFIQKNPYRKLFFIRGDTRSGKSVLAGLLHAIFGEYAIAVTSNAIMRINGSNFDKKCDVDSISKAWFIDLGEMDER
jgi:phage/plasmid-associated DNA primase